MYILITSQTKNIPAASIMQIGWQTPANGIIDNVWSFKNSRPTKFNSTSEILFLGTTWTNMNIVMLLCMGNNLQDIIQTS